MHSSSRGSAFRQWLCREDCPTLLKSVARLLDKASNNDADIEMVDDIEDEMVENEMLEITADMIPGLAISGAHFLSRVQAPRGFYTIPSALGVGNSYVGFHPNGDRSSEWVAGRIHHIFKDISGGTKLAIKRSIALTQGVSDPFRAFWANGFQAKLVSTEFSNELEIVDIDWIRGHSARWELDANLAVILDLSKVS